MPLKINDNLTNINSNSGNASRIKYIVIHYTANNGDTAWGNTNYFKSTYRGASAHYFVDENSIWRSVADKDIAWHCGAKSYKHPACRNSNSIGIEMCSRKDGNGVYYIKDEVVNNTIALVGELMDAYNIPLENVVRHHDVTGKSCPEPFVRLSELWTGFKERLAAVEALAPAPEYPASEENLTAMKALGIINSPAYWQSVTTVQYLDTLLTNAAKDGICDARISNGIGSIEKAFDVLVDAGVISSPEYWRSLINVDEKIQYLDGLLLNMANKCRIVLEKIIHAEAKGEGLEGQTLVGNVIMNRCKSPAFSNGIYNVVLASSTKDGVTTYQFAPIGNGAYKAATPSVSVKAAVSKVLEGEDNSQGATYFCSIAEAKRPGNWHEKALTFLFEHGGHRFYKR